MGRRKHPDLEIEILDITPEMAEQWLEKNTHNRKKSDRLIDVYAEAMANDEWVLNGEPIIFDKTDRLQSGQHRLWAVVQSGVTIRSVVIWGAEPNYIYSLDSGRKRRTTDALTLRGEKDVANLATALVWLWRYNHGVMDKGVSPTTTHLMKLLDETPEIRDYVRHANRIKRNLPISAGLVAALLWQFAQLNKDDMEFFAEKLSTGEELSNDSPIYLLRRWLIRTKLESRKPSQAMVAAIIVKGWNAWREHAQVRNLRWAANEAFPEAV